jgi:hypothetical protein
MILANLGTSIGALDVDLTNFTNEGTIQANSGAELVLRINSG